MYWMDERGSALLMSIVVALVLAVIGGSYALVGMHEVRQSRIEEQSMQAFYLARSGADAVAQGLMENPGVVADVLDKTSEPVNFGNGRFQVRVEDGERGQIRLTSTGTVGNQSRIVQLTLFKTNTMPDFNYAIFAAGQGSADDPAIKMEGSAKIIGTAGTNASHDQSIQLAWSTGIEDGDLLIGPGADKYDVVKTKRNPDDHIYSKDHSIESLAMLEEYPTPDFPEFTVLPEKGEFSTPWKADLDYRITEDGRYAQISVSSGRTLKFDLGGQTRKIRVRKFDVGGNIELVNVGEHGKLILYIEEEFNMGGNWDVNYNHSGINYPERLTIYYAGSKVFGNAQFNISGNIVVDDAPIKIGNGSNVEGSVFSRSTQQVTIDGAAMATTGVIYAPNAKVRVDGSARTGAIISNSLLATGNSRIVFDDGLTTDSFPDGIFGNESGTGKSNLSKGYWARVR